jgi:transposase
MMHIQESTDASQALRLDHHGLVAATCHELGIASKINARIGSQAPDRMVQAGEAVVAMILNGLGFTHHRLYLTTQFFEDKPVSWLLGADIEARHLKIKSKNCCKNSFSKIPPSMLMMISL